MAEKSRKFKFIKILKVVGYTVFAFVLLLIVIVLLIRMPSVQNRITQKAIHFLENKIGTKVQLKSLFISFPKKIVLEGLYVEDQSSDTLLYVNRLSIDTDLWGLLNHRVQLNTIELETCTARAIQLRGDSTFNFDYIIQAFAPDSVSSDTTTSPWKVLIGNVHIEKTSLRYDDAHAGNKAEAYIGALQINTDGFDPTFKNYRVSSIELENSRVSFIQSNNSTADSIPPNTESANAFNIDFDNVGLKKVTLHYENEIGRQRLDATLGEFEVDANNISLTDHLIDLKQITLMNSFVSYSQYGAVEAKPNTPSDPKPLSLSSPWNIKLAKITMAHNSLHYYDFSKPVKVNSFDENHLWLRELQLDAENILANEEGIEASIHSLTFNDKSKLSIQSLSGEVKVSNTYADVRNLKLQTQNSTLALLAHASFQSLDQLQNNYQKTKFELSIQKSSVSLKDVLYFVPSLLDSVPLHFPPNTILSIDSKLTGTIDNLIISKLNLQAFNNTSVAVRGSLKGLPDVDHTFMNVKIDRFYTSITDMKNILPDSLIPSSIQLPNWIQITGNFKGTVNKATLSAILTSDAGKLTVTGSMQLGKLPTYDAVVVSSALNLGSILKQGDVGKIDMKASVKGSGFALDSLDAMLDIKVSKLEYKKYEYRDFNLKGIMNHYLFSGTADLKDDNIDFEFKGDMDYQQDVPHYTFRFNLKNADFKALHLSERPLKARAALDIDLATSDFKIMNGTLKIRNVAIFNGEALYKVDSLLFASIDQKGESEVSIRSDILSGDFKGTFNLFSLPTVFKQHVNRYFSLQDNLVTNSTEPQDFKFDLTIKNTDLLTKIIFPDLHSFVPGKIQGEFDSKKNKLDLAIEISKLKYASTSVDSFTVNITSDVDELRYAIRLKEISVDTVHIAALKLTGKIAHDSIHTKLLVFDSFAKEKYVLGGVIKSASTNFRYHFLPDQVVLNYKNWTVPFDNYLQIGARGAVAHNFSLSKETEKISVVTNEKDSSLSFQFAHWQLSNLTKLVEGVVPASGELNGDFKFTTARKGEFNSTLLINQLSLFEQNWGDASLSLNFASNRYTIDMKVKGKETNLMAKGFFMPSPSLSTFNIDVVLFPFDLALIEPLSFNQLKNVKGSVKGTVTLSGNTKAPSLRGSLTFQDASFVSTYLNNSFSLKNESISFEEKGIVLADFKVTDKQNNEASIKGSILTQYYKDFDFDLKVTSRNFQLLNTTIEDNGLYFGNVMVNTNARITGNMNQPKIDMTAALGKGSRLTYVVPVDEKNALEQKGIVRFVSKKQKTDPFLINLNLQDTVQSLFRGMDMNATLELTDQSTLNIVIDPATGDQLSLRGNSTLVLNSEASGSINLSGRYEITSGTYNFSFYKLLKREFDIVKGSSITWSGDPLNADMDIRASYRVETSPLDLVYNQINTSDQTEINSYNQRLPFLVFLNIKGKLLVPELSFALDMPDDKRNVMGGSIYAKLQDINTRESDLNKQVFALLILKRFISDNPFESQAGGSASNTARASVSRILSEQLNQLSKNIKGVQLDFDIKSYENNTGTEVNGQTKAQLGVSKNLFNDRLVVKLSGNVDIEGQNTNQSSVTDYIGDLALEYKLTRDGRLRVTGFRTSNYDMIDGELTETGVGLIYIKDYNTLQELFRANEKQK